MCMCVYKCKTRLRMGTQKAASVPLELEFQAVVRGLSRGLITKLSPLEQEVPLSPRPPLQSPHEDLF